MNKVKDYNMSKISLFFMIFCVVTVIFLNAYIGQLQLIQYV